MSLVFSLARWFRLAPPFVDLSNGRLGVAIKGEGLWSSRSRASARSSDGGNRVSRLPNESCTRFHS